MRKLLTALLLLTLLACQSESRNPLQSVDLKTPSGQVIKTSLVYSPHDMEQGLSGVQSQDFSDDQGMLFFYTSEQEMHFWMPDTYFDLDLFFLDKELKITDIIRKLPHYIGRANPELIPRARGVWAKYVLEMKAGSSIADKIKIGDSLVWKSSLDLVKTEEAIKKELTKN
jgi:uncharacterized membrane protein (UPF0127 family)